MFKVVVGEYLRLFVQVFGLPFKTFEPTGQVVCLEHPGKHPEAGGVFGDRESGFAFVREIARARPASAIPHGGGYGIAAGNIDTKCSCELALEYAEEYFRISLNGAKVFGNQINVCAKLPIFT
jgi:hypothetical protein